MQQQQQYQQQWHKLLLHWWKRLHRSAYSDSTITVRRRPQPNASLSYVQKPQIPTTATTSNYTITYSFFTNTQTHTVTAQAEANNIAQTTILRTSPAISAETAEHVFIITMYRNKRPVASAACHKNTSRNLLLPIQRTYRVDMNCSCVDCDVSVGPLSLNYLMLYKCTATTTVTSVLMFAALIVWLFLLFYLLGHTADAYFSPTLSNICDTLHVSYDVAGVTLLAFGNGAPDVFSAIAANTNTITNSNNIQPNQNMLNMTNTTSVTSADDLSMGLNALLGAGVFVTTAVVGCVALVTPVHVQQKAFVRDVLFYMLSLLLLFVLGLHASVTTVTSLTMLLLYVVYVVVVVAMDFVVRICGRKKQNKYNLLDDDVDACDTTMEMIGVMSAFWHPPVHDDDEVSYSLDGLSDAPILHNSHRNIHNSDSSTGDDANYLFLTKGEMAEDMTESRATTSSQQQQQQQQQQPAWVRSGGWQDGAAAAAAAAAAGGSIKAVAAAVMNAATTATTVDVVSDGEDDGRRFRHAIISNYFTVDGVNSCNNNDNDEEEEVGLRCSGYSGDGDEVEADVGVAAAEWWERESRSASESLQDSLLGDDEVHVRRPSRQRTTTRTAFRGLYWSHLQWRRRAKRQFVASLWDTERSIVERVVVVLVYPLHLIRIVTIPLIDEDNWSRLLASLQPSLALLWMVFAGGLWNEKLFGFRVYVIAGLTGALLMLPIYCTTHRRYAPKSKFYAGFFLFFAFGSCIAWIYMLATEVVCVLTTFGIITGIPDSVMGLTVLAWGNSLGDLISNVAVARDGFAEMAIAGCYGGPVFNLLVGLGASLVILVNASPTHTLPLVLDESAMISVYFLGASLTLSLLVLRYNNYHIPRAYAVTLILAYILFTCACVLRAVV